MQADAYRAFTADLRDRVAADERVLGLVAVGSMADRDYAPDDWSDHDFFLITRSGDQEAFRTDLGWLPQPDDIAFSFRETAHGLKVFYDDGHMIEFAVFDLDEIGLAGVNRYRVLLDRGGVEQRCADVRDKPRAQPDDEHLFGMVLGSALVAVGRSRRGEVLSGSFFVTWALMHLARLLARTVPTDRAAILDGLDALRRFEQAYPELGTELAAIVRLPPDEAAARLLDVLERELRPRKPELAWDALAAVRGRIAA